MRKTPAFHGWCPPWGPICCNVFRFHICLDAFDYFCFKNRHLGACWLAGRVFLDHWRFCERSDPRSSRARASSTWLANCCVFYKDVGRPCGTFRVEVRRLLDPFCTVLGTLCSRRAMFWRRLHLPGLQEILSGHISMIWEWFSAPCRFS